MLDARARSAALHLLAEEVAFRASRALEGEGVRHLVVKGLAAAKLLRDDPLERPFADVDVLVAWRDQRRAGRALARAGFARGPIATTHSTVWAAPLRDAPDVDLQGWLGYALVPAGGFDALFSTRVALDTRKGDVPAASPLDLGIVSAIHAVRDRLRSGTRTLLDDVAQAERRFGEDALRRRSIELAVERIVAIAADAARGRIGIAARALRRGDAVAPRVFSAAPALLVDGAARGAASFVTTASVLAIEHLARRIPFVAAAPRRG